MLFAHGMGHVPDPAAVGGQKFGLADDLSISENHEMVHVCIV